MSEITGFQKQKYKDRVGIKNVHDIADSAEIAVGSGNLRPLDNRGFAISLGYACFALLLLTLANVFNYFDRYLMSVTAEYVKADLKLTDAELGFLFGTAFSLLFGVVGIPMGRLSDHISRTKLTAYGLAWWSAMTGLAGGAGNFGQFAGARIGVGLGEAVLNPCSHSLISEYFPANVRSTALGFYFAGAFVGVGGAFVVGGYAVTHWAEICTVIPLEAACRVRPWQAAFVLAAVPGILLAVLIAGLREPARRRPAVPHSTTAMMRELLVVIPFCNLVELARLGGGRAVSRNVLIAGALALAVILLSLISGDWYQWLAASISVYALSSWAQSIHLREPGVFALTFGDRSFRLIMFSTALIAVVTTTVEIWAAPFAIRSLKLPAAQVGLYLGTATVIASVAGGIIGGVVADWWKRHDRRAPIWINLLSLLLPLPALIGMVSARTLQEYFVSYGFFCLFAHINAAPVGALIQDLSLPRMRGTVSAVNAMVILTFATSIGPYLTGKVSTATGSLALGMLSLLVFVPAAIIVSLLAAKSVVGERIEERELRAAQADAGR